MRIQRQRIGSGDGGSATLRPRLKRFLECCLAGCKGCDLSAGDLDLRPELLDLYQQAGDFACEIRNARWDAAGVGFVPAQ